MATLIGLVMLAAFAVVVVNILGNVVVRWLEACCSDDDGMIE